MLLITNAKVGDYLLCIKDTVWWLQERHLAHRPESLIPSLGLLSLWGQLKEEKERGDNMPGLP